MGIIARMCACGYSLGYIRNVRNAMRFAHHYANLPNPTEDEHFLLLFDCIARKLGDAHPFAKLALPLSHLREIGRQIGEGGSTHEIQDWAILTLCYFSVFRRENVCALRNGHVQPLGGGFRIWLPRSKTDQTGRGHEVFIDPLPREPALCPVRAIARWKALLDDDPDLPFFRHLGVMGFITQKPLADRTIARILKRYVARMGIDPRQYAANSLRAGLITEAILAGVPLTSIAHHTGHRTLESIFRYFRPAIEQRINIVQMVATAQPRGLIAQMT